LGATSAAKAGGTSTTSLMKGIASLMIEQEFVAPQDAQ
jgi:hypothetical protein